MVYYQCHGLEVTGNTKSWRFWKERLKIFGWYNQDFGEYTVVVRKNHASEKCCKFRTAFWPTSYWITELKIGIPGFSNSLNPIFASKIQNLAISSPNLLKYQTFFVLPKTGRQAASCTSSGSLHKQCRARAGLTDAICPSIHQRHFHFFKRSLNLIRAAYVKGRGGGLPQLIFTPQ